MILISFFAFLLLSLEVWSLLPWKFGAGSYARSKNHLPLVLQSVVPWIKTLDCVESSKQCADDPVYDGYSFGIGIGRYIGFTDKGNVLLVSLSVSADTDFYIGC